MKKQFLLSILVLLIIFTQYAFAQNIHTLAVQNTPTVDGIYHAEEWIGSDSVSIDLLNGTSVSVKFKRDETSLYFLFYGAMGSYAGVYTMYPEVVFDPLYNGGNAWQADDQWFHVSYTDCSSIGEADNYDNCTVTQPDWFGMPNFSSGIQPDTIEVDIPFAKLNIDVQTTDTIGFCLMTNTASGDNNFWRIWPQTADKFMPQTWAKIAFDHSQDIDNKVLAKDKPNVWFDSESNRIHIHFNKNPNSSVEAELIDITGKPLIQKKVMATDAHINVSNLKTGIYFVALKTDHNNCVQKVIINR